MFPSVSGKVWSLWSTKFVVVEPFSICKLVIVILLVENVLICIAFIFLDELLWKLTLPFALEPV